jgi:hypothetical protein
VNALCISSAEPLSAHGMQRLNQEPYQDGAASWYVMCK